MKLKISFLFKYDIIKVIRPGEGIFFVEQILKNQTPQNMPKLWWYMPEAQILKVLKVPAKAPPYSELVNGIVSLGQGRRPGLPGHGIFSLFFSSSGFPGRDISSSTGSGETCFLQEELSSGGTAWHGMEIVRK